MGYRLGFRLAKGVRMSFGSSGPRLSLRGGGMSASFGPSSARAIPLKDDTVRRPTNISQTFQLGDKSEDETVHHSRPQETTYRIAALLAAVVIGGADREEAAIRIAGLLPARFPDGSSSPIYAKSLLDLAQGLDGTSYTGLQAIRRSIVKNRLHNTELVGEAVAAVRASIKAKRGHYDDRTLPVEWYRDGGVLKYREYEAPSMRARVPAHVLELSHQQQIEFGRQRMQDPALQKLLGESLVIRLAAYAIVAAVVGLIMFGVAWIISVVRLKP